MKKRPQFLPVDLSKAARSLSSMCRQAAGVVANTCSAIILPEGFHTALTVARNLRRGTSRLTAVDFDMIEHYRPTVNVVTRPSFRAGRGFSLVGHHEITIPLLAWGLKAGLSR